MAKKMAHDWPFLQKYRQQNALVTPLKKDENRIVFMGDSITEFWPALCPDFFIEKPYINRGISGQTTPQMLIRFRADVIALHPTIVVLLAGINDIAGNTGPSTPEMIVNNIFSMAELAKVHHIKVILCSILPTYDLPRRTVSFPAEKIAMINTTIKQYADTNEMLYLDYYTPMVNEQKKLKANYSDDGLHPNKAGYQVMNNIVEKAIRLLLK